MTHETMSLDEIKTALARLDWYERREPYVRSLTGAAEDAGVWTDVVQDEWRMLVSWEQDNKQP